MPGDSTAQCRPGAPSLQSRLRRWIVVKRISWLLVLVVAVAACGGTSTAGVTPSATNPSSSQARPIELSGSSFEVHQEPG